MTPKLRCKTAYNNCAIIIIVSKKKQKTPQNDSKYFLKLVIALILGFFWVRFGVKDAWQIPLPIGLILGVLLISRDKFKTDRKIAYAVLLISMLIGFWVQSGIFIQL